MSYGLFSAFFKTDSSHPCSFSFPFFTSSFRIQLFIVSVEVCSFCFFSFFAASCLHFVLLFWNQTFSCVSDKPNMAPIWSRPCVWWRTWLLGNAFPGLDAAAAWRLGDTKGGWKFKAEVRMGGVPSFYRNGKSGKWTSGCSENNNKIKLILTPSTNFGNFFWYARTWTIAILVHLPFSHRPHIAKLSTRIKYTF